MHKRADFFQWDLQTLFSEGHISYYTTVRGPDILRNGFFGICYILPNQYIFRNYIIFYYSQNVSAGRMTWRRRPDLARGP